MPDALPLSPLIEQYEGVKARYPGHLVLFRVGDFYETFGDDAKLLSRELEVVLTARAADGRGDRMPMAGVPHHAVDSYVGRLVRKGYKVALCDQVEDARFAKGLVRREVTRVLTPGTLVEDRILPGPDHNFLAAVDLPEGGTGIWAAVDVSTGDWFDGRAELPGAEGLLTVLAPFAPREVLFSPAISGEARRGLEGALKHELGSVRLDAAPEPLSLEEAPASLRRSAEVDPLVQELALRLGAYVKATQPRLLPYLERVAIEASRARLILDPKTLRHLEIARPMNPDDPSGPTLLGLWDHSQTAAGHRTLAFWLKNPLADVVAIRERQDAVEEMVAMAQLTQRVRSGLRHVADLARIAGRLASRRLAPNELGALRSSLRAVDEVRAIAAERCRSSSLVSLLSRLAPIPDLVQSLERALPEEPTAVGSEGRIFRDGFDQELDRLAGEEQRGLKDLELLESEEQRATGIRTLHIGYNQVFGYYLEVSRPNLAKVPAHYRRKQTLSQGERYTTERLGEIERSVLSAREARSRRESERWESFLSDLESHIPAIHRLARALGELDALTTFAHVAIERGHVRPVVDDSPLLQIRDGRHPVLDRLLAGQFVPNDTQLDGEGLRMLVLTGPNMSGKSTYMRQVGLIVVLAQSGAFVPAKYARIGLVRSLFTRMGFTDEIGRGKSSFMVEMSEVAEILRAADARSLVLLDEVGRGTSTFDGLALAWGTLHYLHDRTRCRTILATHYHQLTELIGSLAEASNAHMAVRDTGGDVVFLHRLVPGSTDRSYGLHVARLAGLPSELLADSERLLRRLERDGVSVSASGSRPRRPTQYTQGVLLATETTPAPSRTEEALRSLEPDRLTPIEALEWIVRERRRLLPPDEPR